MQGLAKYAPWIISLILGVLCVVLGTGTPGLPAPATVTVVARDTLRDTVWNTRRVPVRIIVTDSSGAPLDSARRSGALLALVAERDSLNREILRLGATRADVDTVLTLAIGDSSRVRVRVRSEHEVEQGFTTIRVLVEEAILAVSAECPPGTVQWIVAAAGAVAAVLAAVIK